MKYSFLALLWLVTSISVTAQTPKEELNKVIQTYSALNTFSVQVHYHIYTNHTATESSEEAFGSFQKDGNKFRSDQYGTELIQDGHHVFVKDDSSKVIVLSPAQKSQEGSLNIEETLAQYDRIESIEPKKKGQLAFRVFFKQQGITEYEKAEVYADRRTNLIDEMVLYYSKAYDVSKDPTQPDFQQPKIRMVYTTINTSPKFAAETFQISKYINYEATGKPTVKAKYKSYEFYDQTK